MVLVEHPVAQESHDGKPDPYSKEWFEITYQQCRRAASTGSGKPLLYGHRSEKVGSFHRVYFDEHTKQLIGTFSIDTSTPIGRLAHNAIKHKVARDVSLSSMHPSGDMIEGSLCVKGARPDTRVVKYDGEVLDSSFFSKNPHAVYGSAYRWVR